MLNAAALYAHNQFCNVAFFQAGDMTEAQQNRRLAISISGKSDQPRYCGKILVPTLDCAFNQDDTCVLKIRTCKTGVLIDPIEHELLSYEDAEGYSPCVECIRRKLPNYKGAHWWREIEVEPLEVEEAWENYQKFRNKLNGKRFFLSTHATQTLTVQQINDVLLMQQEIDGFVPDVIIVDYADIMASSRSKEFRHTQNEIWSGLRALAIEKHCLVMTATQADSESNSLKSISLKNFTEDKRKHSHVTMYLGLNQTKKEKREGIIRVSTLLSRDDEFDSTKEVCVLQSLKIGKPYLGSYIYHPVKEKKRKKKNEEYEDND